MHRAAIDSRRAAIASAAGLLTALIGGCPGVAAARTPARCTTLPAPAQHVDGIPYAQQRFDPARLAALATGRRVTVAVVDSGVDARHPQLAGHVLPGHDFLRSAGDARRDCNGHGTGVASIIVAPPSPLVPATRSHCASITVLIRSVRAVTVGPPSKMST